MNQKTATLVVATAVVTTLVNRKFANSKLKDLTSYFEDQINFKTALAYNHGFGDGHAVAANHAELNRISERANNIKE